MSTVTALAGLSGRAAHAQALEPWLLYTFDTGTFDSTQVLDQSGNDHHGTFGATAPTFSSSGYQGAAFAFSAGSDVFGTPGSSFSVPIDINPSQVPAFTFGGWFEASSQTVSTGRLRGLLSHDDGGYDRTIGLDYRNPDGTLSAGLKWTAFTGSGEPIVLPGAPVVANTWTFVVARYDQAAGQVTLNINGNQYSSPTNVGSGHTTMRVGANSSFDYPFDGRMDNLFAFDRLLSDTEVATIRANGAVAFRSPVARWYVGPAGPGNWSDSANWSATDGGAPGASPPTNSDSAFITSSVSSVVNLDVDINGTGLELLDISGTGGASPQLVQNSHSVVVNDRIFIGNAPGTRGTYNMSGGALALTGSSFVGPLQIGVGGAGTFGIHNDATLTSAGNVSLGIHPNSEGHFQQTGGTVTIGTPGSPRTLYLGRGENASGTYTLSSSTGASQLVVNGSMQVGWGGSGTFNQTGGTAVVHGMVLIANATTSFGSMSVTGGTFTADGIVVGGDIGNSGGSGTLTVSNATVTSVAGMTVWENGTVSLGSDGVLNVGTTPADNIFNAGTITNNGGTLNVSGTINNPPGRGSALRGTAGIIRQTAGSMSLDANTAVDQGTVRIEGGTAGAIGNLIIGRSADSDGNLEVAGGTVTVNGVLAVGNSGTITAGSGTGHVQVVAGTLRADTVVLGSSVGGTGDMTVSGTGQVIVGGGLLPNTLNVNGGAVTVLDQDPPPGEDPVLDRSMVAGYLRDGAMNVTAGTVTTPNMKLGVSLGNAGTYTQTGGTANVGVLGVGNSGTMTGGQGTGVANISAGTLNADTILLGSTAGGVGTMNVSGTAQVIVGGGLNYNTLNVNGGAVTVLDQAPPPGEDPMLDRSMVGGYLRDGAMNVTAGTVTTPNMKLGVSLGNAGTYTQTGGTVNVGVMGVGNSGTMTTGQGTGVANITAGTLNADTVLLGSTTGGTGTMNVSGTAQVIVGGGLSANTLNVNGGAVTVLDQDPPPGEDPVLDRSMVGGYLRNGAMNVTAGTVTAPNMKIGVSTAQTGTYTQSGGSVNVGTLLLGSAAGGIGTMTVGGGSFTASTLTQVRALGQLRSAAPSIMLGNTQLLDGGDVIMSVNGNNLLRTTALAIDTADSSLVDLADNDMIVGNGTSRAQVEAYIAQARNGGDWSMPGVTSSSAASHAQGATMLGVMSGAEYIPINGSTFNGQTVIVSDTLVKYTWYGDADFNGEVNFDDYVRIDNGFNFGLTGWLNGDFDLSGGIDFDDVVLIDLGFNAQNGTLRRAQAYIGGDDRSMHGMDDPALGMLVEHFSRFGVDYGARFLAAVPEPASVCLPIAAFIGCIVRRSRHRGSYSEASM